MSFKSITIIPKDVNRFLFSCFISSVYNNNLSIRLCDTFRISYTFRKFWNLVNIAGMASYEKTDDNVGETIRETTNR